MKCTLDPMLHQCRFLDRDKLQCKKSGTCTYQEQPKPTEPARKEKWFEQYYTKTRYV